MVQLVVGTRCPLHDLNRSYGCCPTNTIATAETGLDRLVAIIAEPNITKHNPEIQSSMLTTYLKKIAFSFMEGRGFCHPDLASGRPQWDIALDPNIGSCYVYTCHGLEVGAIAPQTVSSSLMLIYEIM